IVLKKLTFDKIMIIERITKDHTLRSVSNVMIKASKFRSNSLSSVAEMLSIPNTNVKQKSKRSSLRRRLSSNVSTEEEDNIQSNESYTLQTLSSLVNDGKYSDVCFIIDDEEGNKEKCKYEMFCSSIAFKLLIRYIYTGSLGDNNLSDSEVIDLFSLCERIKFTSLKRLVAQRMTQVEESIANSVHMFHALYETGNIETLSKCLNILDKNAATSNCFVQLSNEQHSKYLKSTFLKR
ncbi:hypothetical protein B4U80_14325, partial [Leptotrombidium deliense]